MTEPQIWVLIGVFAASTFGMIALVSGLFIRVLRAEIATVRADFRAEFTTVRAEIGALRSDMESRFTALDGRVDGLDRDVQALVKHTFGLER